MKCITCGGEMQAPRRANVPYRSLPGVLLCGVEVRECAECHEEETTIPRIDELDWLLARIVANKPGRLSGPEIRFLRKVMGWSGRALARFLDVYPETVSRWENDKDQASRVAERLLRVLVFKKMEPVDDYEAFERWIDKLDAQEAPRRPVSVVHGDDGWHTEEECRPTQG